MEKPRASISVILKPDGRCQVTLGEDGSLERLWISDCSIEAALGHIKTWLESKIA